MIDFSRQMNDLRSLCGETQSRKSPSCENKISHEIAVSFYLIFLIDEKARMRQECERRDSRGEEGRPDRDRRREDGLPRIFSWAVFGSKQRRTLDGIIM